MTYEYAINYAYKIDTKTKEKSEKPLTKQLSNDDRVLMENNLNRMGMAGFELINIDTTDDQIVWYFKKSIPWWNFWS